MSHIADTTSIINIEAASKTYGPTVAVDTLNLTVRRGECLALIGHNGAGKTTLFKMLLGLTPCSAGQIRVREREPQHPSNRWAVAYLPEVVAFPGALKGIELLQFYGDLKNRPRSECDELLELVGLADAARHRVSTYSKGMRQRLGLAQVLLGNPEIILLDEPTSGLDPAVKKQFYAIIEDCKQKGATILISSHALSEIETRVDRIAILRRGKLVQTGTLDELRRRANLPVQFRVFTQDGQVEGLINALQGDLPWTRINAHCLEFQCPPEQKLSLLQSVSRAELDVSDIEIIPPNLDDLYMHFAGQDTES